MIDLLGPALRLCDQISRREMLRIGGLAPLGVSLSSLLAAQSRAAESHGAAPLATAKGSFGRAKRCLMLYMWGGPAHQDTLDLKPSYWKEGGLIGAGVLGLSGLIVAAEFCGYSDTGDDDCTLGTIGGAVVGSALGFGVGALIGGMFPKPVPDSVTVTVPGAAPVPEAQGWSAGKIAATALLATGGAFLGGDLAGALGVIGGIGLGVFVGSRLP